MPRPRKVESDQIENWFYDLPNSEQEQVLRTLNTLARLKRRQKEPAGDSKVETAPEPQGEN